MLDAAQHASDNRVTWSPEKGVRIASVTVATNDYYVVSGRSLKEVESREAKIAKLTMIGWLASLVMVVVVDAVSGQNLLRKKKHSRR